jgi:regulator of protease activity HflC (stomatin/prohibitin superfamily)
MIGHVVFALGLVALVGVTMSVRVIKQYERVVLFELGRVKDGARGPGLIFFVRSSIACTVCRFASSRCRSSLRGS